MRIENMMQIPYDIARKYHRYMWRWIARNPSQHKSDWPGWATLIKEYGYPGTTFNCLACEIACNAAGRGNMCLACPIDGWGGPHHKNIASWCGSSNATPYMLWIGAIYLYKEKLALSIAEAPWRCKKEFYDSPIKQNI